MAFSQQKDDNVHTARFGADPALDRRESVAATLRRARERHGQDVRSIAQVLRIRQAYLEALESGQYDRLPGIAYAIGFLRSYADFLGLNATDLIDRFKEEAQGAERRTELVFPEPVTEGRIPGGAVILISVVLLGVAYGGWFYLSNQGRTVADLIPALPEQLQTLIESETDAPEPAAPVSEAAMAAAPASPTPDRPAPDQAGAAQARSAEPAPKLEQGAEAAAPTGASDRAQETATARVAPPPAPRVEARETPVAAVEPSRADPVPAPASAARSTLTSGPEPAPDMPAQPAEAAQIAGLPPSHDSLGATDAFPGSAADAARGDAPAPVPDQAPAEAMERRLTLSNSADPAHAAGNDSTVEETVVIPAPSAPPAPPAPSPGAAGSGERQPRTYGESNDSARIVLRALQDSWVQVRDRHDALLLTRVLRTGDVYQVPNQPGLTLLTGNAGGIEIEVDGVKMPPLGPIGAVRRQIALDPAVLTAGASRQ